MRKLALQLYTVRESLGADFVGTLKQIAAIGYKGIEGAGNLGDMPARDLAKILDDLGLKMISGHVSLEAIRNGLDREIDAYAALGARYLGLAWMAAGERRDAAAYRALAGELETIARKCAPAGLTFFHHNHDFEFEQYGGQYGLDILLGASDPALVKSELDVYWAAHAGVDPSAYLRRLSGRAPLVHLKDMSMDAARTFEIVGEGSIDFAPIMAASDETGVDWHVVEQDRCPKGELHSARASFDNLRAKGWF
jgi:sugar phosphate isomerase/epimerase